MNKKQKNATIEYWFSPSIKYFTLVELTMAIAVIAIGMAGVMALLPVGLNATRDAMADNYTADMADQFLHYTAVRCKMPNTAGGTPYDWNDATHLVKKMPSLCSARVDASTYKTDATITSEETSLDIQWDNPDFLNVCKGSASSPNDSDTTGTYGIIQKSGTVTDFRAIVRIWKSPIQYFDSSGASKYITSDGTVTGDIEYGVRLNCEIAWPPEKPYSMREKRNYILEIFNKKK